MSAMRRRLNTRVLILLIGTVSAVPSQGADSFVNFETPQVHPVALSPDKNTLAVCNTADNRIELFDLQDATPVSRGAVPVGLDPVSVRFRSDSELWVVNQISDSISVLDLNTQHITATIETLDEPADVVFADDRAFVSCSQVDTVQVFAAVTHDHLADIPIDGEDPRAMALSPDESLIYVAVFESGNRSTVLAGGLDLIIAPNTPNVVNDSAGPYQGQNPPPNAGNGFFPAIEVGNPPAPEVALIVRKNDQGAWMDDNGGDWTEMVSGSNSLASGRVAGWDVLDNDVAIIDVATMQVVGYVEGLMNACMAVGVNPATGEVTVVGTDATNEIRFEPNVTGTFIRVNMGIADGDGAGTPLVVDLNPHLDYAQASVVQSERDKSLGDPRGVVWNAAGTRGYVTGMGSNNVIAIDSVGARASAVPIEVGEGPTGLALDESRDRLYVLNRFAATLSAIDITTDTVIENIAFFDPTPEPIKVGRKHLYDTHATSGLGQLSCASCHIDARMDRLAWDLGNPAGGMELVNPETHNYGAGAPGIVDGLFGAIPFEDSHPMKGPMTTQTLQDIIGKEPFHWRGDRAGIENFNPAFVGLNGADDIDPGPDAGGLTDEEMQEFKDFLATIYFQPNPHRNFDNSLPTNLELPHQYASGIFEGDGGLARGETMPPGNAVRGLDIYMGTLYGAMDINFFNCVTCHTLPIGNGADTHLNGSIFEEFPRDANGNNHVAVVSIDGSTNRVIKVPQLRNVTEKSGMDLSHSISRTGFGFLHDGTIDSMTSFLAANVFAPRDDQDVSDLVALMFAFSGSDFGNPPQNPALDLLEAPVSLMESLDAHAAVGKQITINAPTPTQEQSDHIAASIVLAQAGVVELIVRGHVDGQNRAWLLIPGTRGASGALFQSDAADETILETDLIALAAAGSELTFTVVPTGTGERIALDRDEDTYYDFDETAAGSNPADNADIPTGSAGETRTTVDGLCFIATAAYGTPLAEEIVVLRTFRDRRMLTNPLGAAFTDVYYRLSPPVATSMREAPFVRMIVRALLLPLLLTIQGPTHLILPILIGTIIIRFGVNRARMRA